MSNTFKAVVTATRKFDKVGILNLKVEKPNDRFQYVDAKFPVAETPDLMDGTPVSVTYTYLPEARGYESKKENPNTGKPYINATVEFWKPEIAAEGYTSAPTPPSADDEAIPF